MFSSGLYRLSLPDCPAQVILRAIRELKDLLGALQSWACGDGRNNGFKGALPGGDLKMAACSRRVEEGTVEAGVFLWGDAATW